ncbi:MAG TPA: mechanosensitive ion channel, partial [Woeseiaceae bacterium]|nr:mechanosensitive ion channel [Woeseiaceae bacterium]
MKKIKTKLNHKLIISIIAGFFLLSSPLSFTQESDKFNPIAANAELDLLKRQIDGSDVSASFLNTARIQALNILNDASVCYERSTADRERLEIRFAPLKDIDADVSPSIFDQRNAIRNLLDEVTARQISCSGATDEAATIVERISIIQEELSEQYLSYKSKNLVEEMLGFPLKAKESLSTYQNAQYLNLTSGLSITGFFWLLIFGGLLAAGFDLYIRKKSKLYLLIEEKSASSKLLHRILTQPMARHSSSLLIGLFITLILYTTIAEPSLDRMIIRVGLSIFLFGVTSIIIDWVTSEDSPAIEIEGFIPEHVKPLRFRLALLQISLIASFIVFGTNWLTIRLIDPDVTGRAAIIFLVAATLLYVHLYLGRISGLENKFRLIRSLITLTLSVSIIAVIVGYQNFAGYLIHGITRSSIALFLVWIILWLISMSFDYLTRNESPTAVSMRRNLGIQKEGSTGLGFVQLVSDLVIWLSLFVYLVYVWDASGTTVDRLFELIVLGGTVGNIQLVPAQLIGGMLIFTALLALIGWLKRWIDRRWLQHIVIERGAREALITLFGYVGFIIALLFGLTQAGVDLGGLAIISGALALGIGFGMQEIAGNFVSGLILLFERPIRAGDFISVGEIEGFVRKISIRATEIETLDNQNVLVPNSELVSGRVTNWVLRDTQGRLRILVGVAYGSDVEKVQEILEKIANDHPEVITDGRAPAPRALFMGFGDSSLDFELRCRINRIDRR